MVSSEATATQQLKNSRFVLNLYLQSHIDGWLKFLVKKKVEMIELDFADNDGHLYFGPANSYNFPLRLSHRNMRHLSKWPSPNTTNVEIWSLKQLFLKNVNMREEILEQFLSNSPNLETISIHGSGDLIHIRGGSVDLILVNLRNPSKLICQGFVGLEDNLFKQISSCALSLKVFSFLEYHPQLFLNLDSLPVLPNVKELTLIIGAHEDQSLLSLISIANACPSLEVLTVKLLSVLPIKRRTEVMHVATNHHEHLKLFQILGYSGRVSDLELAAYVIENAVAIQKSS